MVDVEQLSSVVQRNCHISDARHARTYTMCIYLLKMREYYRWEMGLDQAERLPGKEVGEWLTRRERLWEDLEPEEFSCIPVGEGCHDPFGSTAINADLNPAGFVYSAGYGRFVKPHFFLARLERSEHRDGFHVLVAADELARDLAAPPAMQLGETVYVRRDALRRHLWQSIEDWRWRRQPDGAMARAMALHGFDGDPEGALARMTDAEIEPVVLHELGEGAAGRELGGAWEEMLLQVAGSRAEIGLRAVRDLLADCASTLPWLLEAGAEASLHYYFANLRGMRKALFPRLGRAYDTWVEDGSTAALADAAEAGREHWAEVAARALELAADCPPATAPDALAGLVEAQALD